MAHAYSTDSPERQYIPFFIASAAIAAAFVTFHLLDTYNIQLPWWASPPIDTMAFYGSFYWLFDRSIWKWKWIHRLQITRIPDLSGVWHGHVKPSQTDVSTGLELNAAITISIRQTWTSLLLAGQTKLSKSRSLSGSLLTEDECSMSYEYLNEPSPSAPSTMHVHRGTAILYFDKAGTMLNGEYYSGRDRQNIGTIQLARAKKKRA
jgi:hypothetical protein